MTADQELSNEAKNTGVQSTGSLKTSELSAASGYCRDCQPVNNWSAPIPYTSVRLCPRHCTSSLIAAAKAALEYVDNLNEDTPVDPKCKECVGVVYFTKSEGEPPLCWIHQLEKALATTQETKTGEARVS